MSHFRKHYTLSLIKRRVLRTSARRRTEWLFSSSSCCQVREVKMRILVPRGRIRAFCPALQGCLGHIEKPLWNDAAEFSSIARSGAMEKKSLTKDYTLHGFIWNSRTGRTIVCFLADRGLLRRKDEGLGQMPGAKGFFVVMGAVLSLDWWWMIVAHSLLNCTLKMKENFVCLLYLNRV